MTNLNNSNENVREKEEINDEIDLNFFDRFLYKLFISFFLLLLVVILGKYQVIDFNSFKNDISDNINILEYIQIFNGKTKLIDLGSGKEISVSSDIEGYEIIGTNSYRVQSTYHQGVKNYIAGVVVKIVKNDKYEITLKGIDNKTYIYSNLDEINVYIYDYIKTDDFIGNCTAFYYLNVEDTDE